MMIHQNKKSKLFNYSFMITLISLIIAPIILPAIKLSYIVGSFFSFFSLKNCLVPLSGAFGGMKGSLLIGAARMFSIFYFTGELSLRGCALYIPGLLGSLYWASSSLYIRLLLPLTCLILFCIHPVGGAAFLYSLLWLIPIIIYFIPLQSIFLTSLGSTYSIHAVGSVIWLYTTPMTPAMWLALIPIAFMERLFFAAGMTIAHHAITYATHQLKKMVAMNNHRKKMAAL